MSFSGQQLELRLIHEDVISSNGEALPHPPVAASVGGSQRRLQPLHTPHKAVSLATAKGVPLAGRDEPQLQEEPRAMTRSPAQIRRDQTAMEELEEQQPRQGQQRSESGRLQSKHTPQSQSHQRYLDTDE